MRIPLDTNILTRSAQVNHPHHVIATSALLALTRRRDTLCLVPQVIYEFWAVATRPMESHNGLGLSTSETHAHLDDFLRAFTLLDNRPESDLCSTWIRLVLQHDAKGKSSHDARLVSAMNAYGLTSILTFNGAHFARYPGIEVLSPEDIEQ